MKRLKEVIKEMFNFLGLYTVFLLVAALYALVLFMVIFIIWRCFL